MNDTGSVEKSRVMGILSMVFGILAVILSITPGGRMFVFLLGGAAIVLGAIELDRFRRGLAEQGAKNMAIAGIVLGGISLILIIVLPLIWRAAGIGRFDFGIPGKKGLPQMGKLKQLR